MTMTPLTCDAFADRLADHLEHDLDAATQAAMDAHAAGCAECGALLSDLAAIRSDAAALPALVPSRDLWDGVAARIGTPVVPLTASGVGRRPSAVTTQKRRWWKHPALLAAGLVGITAGITHVATREALQDAVNPASVAAAPTVSVRGDTVAPDAPVQAAEGTSSTAATTGGGDDAPAAAISNRGSMQTVRAGTPVVAVSAVGRRPSAVVSYRPGELAALDSLYHREILRLRQILGERRGQLDSTTVTVLERNMDVIDKAIAECRAALAADPASRFLNQQLNEALETKIELLRTAATMPIGS